ncbi:hypothetical protein ACFE04_028244 [Oxalis oulophora]
MEKNIQKMVVAILLMSIFIMSESSGENDQGSSTAGEEVQVSGPEGAYMVGVPLYRERERERPDKLIPADQLGQNGTESAQNQTQTTQNGTMTSQNTTQTPQNQTTPTPAQNTTLSQNTTTPSTQNTTQQLPQNSTATMQNQTESKN